MVSDEGFCTLVVGRLIGLLQILPTLLGYLGLLEGLCKRRNRSVAVPGLAFVVLVQQIQTSEVAIGQITFDVTRVQACTFRY